MKLYKTKSGILIENEGSFFLLKGEEWDSFVNDDNVYRKGLDRIRSMKPADPGRSIVASELEAPIRSQELWAAGVTYLRSKVGRQEESKNAGGGDFYARVYEAERPELFFKGTAQRIVGPGKNLRIRKDSTWNVPEPELTLMVTSNRKIIGYTIGNDMSSRSIEGENPLYLPQAKTYDGSASLGPCIYVPEKPLSIKTVIQLEILRGINKIFEGTVEISQMKRTPEELVSFLYRECSFPHGSLLMTGTGIVPPSNVNLQSGDTVRITIEPIGTLENKIA
ncbi:MAG TPA: fumarylacetoacetate hydrolase family protein [Bacteroidota bacterium]|nr:fumarylacetoacetate hydrolase family protein [Bacteroidota bacterium]